MTLCNYIGEIAQGIARGIREIDSADISENDIYRVLEEFMVANEGRQQHVIASLTGWHGNVKNIAVFTIYSGEVSEDDEAIIDYVCNKLVEGYNALQSKKQETFLKNRVLAKSLEMMN